MARRRSHSLKGVISWQMAEILDGVSDEVRAALAKAVEIVPEETAADLRQTSPQDHGDYAKSWTVKRQGMPSRRAAAGMRPVIQSLQWIRSG